VPAGSASMSLMQSTPVRRPARVVRVRWDGTGYRVVRVGSIPGTDWVVSCASPEQVGSALRGLGVSSRAVAWIFRQLEASEDAEVRV
jgi:hypothetical protein